MPMGRQDALPLTHTYAQARDEMAISLPKGIAPVQLLPSINPAPSRVPQALGSKERISCQLLYRPGYPSKKLCVPGPESILQ